MKNKWPKSRNKCFLTNLNHFPWVQVQNTGTEQNGPIRVCIKFNEGKCDGLSCTKKLETVKDSNSKRSLNGSPKDGGLNVQVALTKGRLRHL